MPLDGVQDRGLMEQAGQKNGNEEFQDIEEPLMIKVLDADGRPAVGSQLEPQQDWRLSAWVWAASLLYLGCVLALMLGVPNVWDLVKVHYPSCADNWLTGFQLAVPCMVMTVFWLLVVKGVMKPAVAEVEMQKLEAGVPANAACASNEGAVRQESIQRFAFVACSAWAIILLVLMFVSCPPWTPAPKPVFEGIDLNYYPV